MGKQTQLHMLPQDMEMFLAYVQKRDPVVVTIKSSDSPKLTPVTRLTPRSLAVFGQSVTGIHMGFLLVNALAIVFIFLLGKRLWKASAGLFRNGMPLLSPRPGQSAHEVDLARQLAGAAAGLPHDRNLTAPR